MDLREFGVLFFLFMRTNAQLKGMRFIDNNQTVPWLEENGNITFDFSSYPVQLSICMKINLEFTRYTTYTGLLYIMDTKTRNILLNFEISSTRRYNIVVEFPGRTGDFEWHFGKEKLKANFLRKWTWFCFSMDYEKQTAKLAVNGRLLESRHTEKLTKDAPSCGNCRLVLGHFYRDSNPILGSLLDFSVWNETISDEDLMAFTNCKSYTEFSGSLIGRLSDMRVQGSLIKPITADLETVQCPADVQNFILYVPAEFIGQEDAMNVCHKLRYGTFGKAFSSVADFLKYNEIARNSKAVRRHSWGGARIQMWMPHLTRTKNPKNFVRYMHDKPDSAREDMDERRTK